MKKVLYRHLFSKVLGLSFLLFSSSFYAQEEAEVATDAATEQTADAVEGDPVKGSSCSTKTVPHATPWTGK